MIYANLINSSEPVTMTISDREGFQIYGKAASEMVKETLKEVSIFNSKLLYIVKINLFMNYITTLIYND